MHLQFHEFLREGSRAHMVYMVTEAVPPQAPTVLTYPDLRNKGVTLSIVSLWRLEREGKFPKRFNLSANRVAWLASEVDAWIAERVAERGKPAPAAPQPTGKRPRGRPRKSPFALPNIPPPPVLAK